MALAVARLWRSLCATEFARVDEDFISSFRRPGGANNRLAAWDPFDATMRYFKFMLYGAAVRQPERFFELYRALGRVDIGQPVAINVHSCAINIDYFLAIEEFMFLETAIDLQSVQSVIEIGAGFGRTCHALLALCASGQLQHYTIVDLPEVLELSRRTLKKLVPAHYRKLRFVDATREGEWRGLTADLTINIDSFQEMPPSTIDSYMQNLIAHSANFYIKNPIAKYDPKDIGLKVEDPRMLGDVFSVGYCRDIIDIFDDVALTQARQTYLNAYCPGPNWKWTADKPMELFPYYHHAMYRRDRKVSAA